MNVKRFKFYNNNGHDDYDNVGIDDGDDIH